MLYRKRWTTAVMRASRIWWTERTCGWKRRKATASSPTYSRSWFLKTTVSVLSYCLFLRVSRCIQWRIQKSLMGGCGRAAEGREGGGVWERYPLSVPLHRKVLPFWSSKWPFSLHCGCAGGVMYPPSLLWIRHKVYRIRLYCCMCVVLVHDDSCQGRT